MATEYVDFIQDLKTARRISHILQKTVEALETDKEHLQHSQENMKKWSEDIITYSFVFWIVFFLQKGQMENQFVNFFFLTLEVD